MTGHHYETAVVTRTARKRHACNATGYYGCAGDIAPGDRYTVRVVLPSGPGGRPEQVKVCPPCSAWFEFCDVEEILDPARGA
jgi:hypothetical protein